MAFSFLNSKLLRIKKLLGNEKQKFVMERFSLYDRGSIYIKINWNWIWSTIILCLHSKYTMGKYPH